MNATFDRATGLGARIGVGAWHGIEAARRMKILCLGPTVSFRELRRIRSRDLFRTMLLSGNGNKGPPLKLRELWKRRR